MPGGFWNGRTGKSGSQSAPATTAWCWTGIRGQAVSSRLETDIRIEGFSGSLSFLPAKFWPVERGAYLNSTQAPGHPGRMAETVFAECLSTRIEHYCSLRAERVANQSAATGFLTV